MGCRGVAVLPEGMSRERFAWLEDWDTDPADVIATSGSESNVKEILRQVRGAPVDPANVIFNQFSEFCITWCIISAPGRPWAARSNTYQERGRSTLCPLRLGLGVGRHAGAPATA